MARSQRISSSLAGLGLAVVLVVLPGCAVVAVADAAVSVASAGVSVAATGVKVADPSPTAHREAETAKAHRG